MGNIGTGVDALLHNTTGYYNTATGFEALYYNTTGIFNTATDESALYYNTGNNKTAIGEDALFYNTTGSNNIALGFEAGVNLGTGNNNIAIGNPGVANESSHIRIGTQGTQTATFIAGIRGAPITGGIPVGVNSSGQQQRSTWCGTFVAAFQGSD